MGPFLVRGSRRTSGRPNLEFFLSHNLFFSYTHKESHHSLSALNTLLKTGEDFSFFIGIIFLFFFPTKFFSSKIPFLVTISLPMSWNHIIE